MKKIVLLFVLAAMCSIVANAATKYEINIAGVEVTSDNASNVTGGDIQSGYAVYNASTNTLTCYSLKIRRSGSGSYGIHNRKCDNLTIVFKGNCEVVTADHAMNLARSTTIVVDDDASVNSWTGGSSNVLNLGSYDYYIKGSGYIDCNGKAGIHGNGSGSTTVYFQGARVYASSKIDGHENHAIESFKAVFNEGGSLKIKANGEKTSVNNVSMYFYGKEMVLEPYGAYYKNSAIFTSSGSEVTSDDIYISDDYVALINADYFPDANFRSALFSLYPKGYISTSEANNRTYLDVSGCGITDLTGLHYFSNLIKLYCNNNNLTSLPTLPSTLRELYCQNNYLTSLPTLPSSMQKLNCGSNKFTTLAITGKTNLYSLSAQNNIWLTSLACIGNGLTSLDVSGCSALKALYCQDNQLTSLGTLPSSIQTINCSNNMFKYLSITGISDLASLNAQDNTSMLTLNCKGNSLTTLLVSGCSALKSIDCSNNQFTTLPTLPSTIEQIDASNNLFTGTLSMTGKSALKTLKVAHNAITDIELDDCSSLTYLDCSYNKIARLDVNSYTKLETLHAQGNGMTSFQCSYCFKLKEVWVCYNNLSSLNLRSCTSLRELCIQKNQIKRSAMTSLIYDLRSIPTSESVGLFGVFEPSYTGMAEGNEFTNTHISDARAKRWIPKQYNNGDWEEIKPNLKGDVNGDGKVNVSDVTALINMIMGITTMDATVADVNGDGKVNVSDVSALINIILGIG